MSSILQAIINQDTNTLTNLLKSHDATTNTHYGVFFEQDGQVIQKLKGKPIHAAAYFGYLEGLKVLYDTYGPSILDDDHSEGTEKVKFEENGIYCQHLTPIQWACYGGQKDAFDFLKNNGASLKGCDTCQFSKLFFEKFK